MLFPHWFAASKKQFFWSSVGYFYNDKQIVFGMHCVYHSLLYVERLTESQKYSDLPAHSRAYHDHSKLLGALVLVYARWLYIVVPDILKIREHNVILCRRVFVITLIRINSSVFHIFHSILAQDNKSQFCRPENMWDHEIRSSSRLRWITHVMGYG